MVKMVIKIRNCVLHYANWLCNGLCLKITYKEGLGSAWQEGNKESNPLADDGLSKEW